MPAGKVLACMTDGPLGTNGPQGAVVFLGRLFSGGEVICELRSLLESYNLTDVPHLRPISYVYL